MLKVSILKKSNCYDNDKHNKTKVITITLALIIKKFIHYYHIPFTFLSIGWTDSYAAFN